MKIAFRCPPQFEGFLPQPVPARRALPDWLHRMPASVASDYLGGDVPTVKQCPPFVDAMSFGFLIPLACDIRVEGGRFDWRWNVPASVIDAFNSRSPLDIHLPDQVRDTPLFDGSRFILKFNNYWTVELEAGYSLLITHPVNRFDLPFRALTGLVDMDLYKDTFTNFPALWVDPAFEGVLAAGTPVVQCFPVPRGALDLEFGRMSAEEEARFAKTKTTLYSESGAYRRHFRESKN